MREKAFGDSALGQTQTYEWFKRFKNDGYHLMKKNFVDDHQLNHNRKCGKHMALKASSIRYLFEQDRK